MAGFKPATSSASCLPSARLQHDYASLALCFSSELKLQDVNSSGAAAQCRPQQGRETHLALSASLGSRKHGEDLEMIAGSHVTVMRPAWLQKAARRSGYYSVLVGTRWLEFRKHLIPKQRSNLVSTQSRTRFVNDQCR